MKAEVIDVTLPAKKSMIGHRHPNSIALDEVERIFIGMGYEVVEGPEVEYADYNFTKLNIPARPSGKRRAGSRPYINDSIACSDYSDFTGTGACHGKRQACLSV